jgi:hypothetical protein
MKKLLFLIIAGLLFSCNNPTEQTSVTNNTEVTKKITTIMVKYASGHEKIIYSGATPDTITPSYQIPQPEYRQVDSIWNHMDLPGDRWQVRVNDGVVTNYNVYGSSQGQTLIKMWRK